MLHKIIALFCVFALAGCASVESPSSSPATPQAVQIPKDAICHLVQKGQTLWRISKIYNVDIDDIARINRLPDDSSISTGQNLIIPSATKTNFTSQNYADFIWPVKGTVVTRFKQKNSGVLSKGVDISTDSQADIVAAREGTVSFIGTLPGYGETLIIDHKDGLSSVYCGITSIQVKTGDTIEQGKTIAKAGQSPRSNASMIHFEIRKKHRPQNPLFYLD
ncbi:MAG TPA: LysM peptidoglycan-binding domain-containing M23 family metallopeptidase [Candidatus Omnitrophota bacterium]|nr:LysM peptidoglycan-binding domain-containing M23 family metallopeptidase [Candidatus Omnitrophota bacterium]